VDAIRIDDIFEVLGDRLGNILGSAEGVKCLAEGRPKVREQTDCRVVLAWFHIRRHSLNKDGQEFDEICVTISAMELPATFRWSFSSAAGPLR
jgi:hypothetical protein